MNAWYWRLFTLRIVFLERVEALNSRAHCAFDEVSLKIQMFLAPAPVSQSVKFLYSPHSSHAKGKLSSRLWTLDAILLFLLFLRRCFWGPAWAPKAALGHGNAKYLVWTLTYSMRSDFFLLHLFTLIHDYQDNLSSHLSCHQELCSWRGAHEPLDRG